MAGYYRRFIENFSKIAKPVTDLLKKDKKFEWSEKAEESFQALKTKLTPLMCLSFQTKARTSSSIVMLLFKGSVVC